MKPVPFFNDSDKFVHVGNVTIPPNESRDVDPRLLPGYQPEARDDGALESDPLLAVQGLSVAKLVNGLAALNDDELVRLEDLERQSESPRKGALAAITEERLRRADQMQDGSGDDPGKNAGGEGE